ncbi:MAG: hypothetical protein K2X86_01500 [Cytophagaceae bacterium]|nr:hypothetical protein [Cytophagaceae bacterium]
MVLPWKYRSNGILQKFFLIIFYTFSWKFSHCERRNAGHPAFDPQKIRQIQANLATHTTPGQDQTGFDFLTFTMGGPFDPSKIK